MKNLLRFICQIVVIKFGGNVNVGMNGKQTYIVGQGEMDARIVEMH